MLVSHLSLKPLPLDMTCSQVVCPDVGNPCALPMALCDLVPGVSFSRRSSVPAVHSSLDPRPGR